MDWKVITLVIPMFMIIGVGGLLQKAKLVEQGFIASGNRLVFHVLMPLLMFISIYETDDFSGVNYQVVFYILGAYLLFFVLGLFLLQQTSFDSESRGIVLQCIVRPNLLLFGLYLARQFYGDQNAAAAMIPIVLAAPVTNFLGVLTYELTNKGKLPLKKLLKSILTNIMIVSFLVALLFKVLQIPLPTPMLKGMKDLGGMTTTLGLLLIGAGLKKEDLSYSAELAVTSAMRNLVIPAVLIPLAVLLGFRDQSLFAIAIVSLAPAAVTSYSLASHYTSKAYLAANIVMMTTLLSIVSIFIALTLLLNFGWISV